MGHHCLGCLSFPGTRTEKTDQYYYAMVFEIQLAEFVKNKLTNSEFQTFRKTLQLLFGLINLTVKKEIMFLPT